MSKSNDNGTLLELLVQFLLTITGYEYIPDGAWLFTHRKDKRLLPEKYYAREVTVGESAKKGQQRRVEFFIVNHDAFSHDGLLCECKLQTSGGSTEDKLFRLSHDIKKTGIPTIVIVDGFGFSQASIDTLKGQVDGSLFRAAWTFMEFVTQITRGFLGTGGVKQIPPRRKTRQPQQQRMWKEEETA